MSEGFPLGKVEVSLTPLARFEEYLQSREKRMTSQRRTLVECVFRHHSHFDAEDLMEDVARTVGHRRVSRPTVYRTLTELVEAGLLRKMDLGGRAVYEHDYGYPAHDHLFCTECKKLFEFQSDDLIRLRDSVAAENGFRVVGHRFIIQGTCQQCQEARRQANRRMPVV
jgi:Fur family ferric uptake transcriptional regulator